MDETRLDLRAADQERMRQWEQAARETTRQVQEVMRMGVGMYPIVGRRGTVYGTRRLPPDEVIETPKDQDEEIKMTYDEALKRAIYHASSIPEGQFSGATARDDAEAHALASRAWSALAGLLRADEVRVDTAAYMQRLQEMGLSPTGRKRDFVRVPSREARRLLDEAAEIRAETDAEKGGI